MSTTDNEKEHTVLIINSRSSKDSDKTLTVTQVSRQNARRPQTSADLANKTWLLVLGQKLLGYYSIYWGW